MSVNPWQTADTKCTARCALPNKKVQVRTEIIDAGILMAHLDALQECPAVLHGNGVDGVLRTLYGLRHAGCGRHVARQHIVLHIASSDTNAGAIKSAQPIPSGASELR